MKEGSKYFTFFHSFVFSLQRFPLYEKTSNNESSESVAWDCLTRFKPTAACKQHILMTELVKFYIYHNLNNMDSRLGGRSDG